MALPDSCLELKSQVEEAGENGAQVLAGGSICNDSNGKGRFFEPTLLRDCTNDMAIMKKESFGPLMPVCKVYNDNEALELMNDSVYGLTAALYSRDYKLAEEMAKKIDHGTVFLNRCDFLHPMLPWTGRKASGYGHGLSKYGFNLFLRYKGLNFNIIQ